MNFYQIAIFLLQGTLVSSLILLLFHLRAKLGLGLLFACLGLFQFIQAFLFNTVNIEIAKNFLLSPGSAVLLIPTLFAILIIYIKEDASEVRKIIYTLLIVNGVMLLLISTIGLNSKDLDTYNSYNLANTFFNNNTRFLIVGTITLFIDSLLIIVTYEFISRKIPYLFFRIFLTMMLVVVVDTVIFTFFTQREFYNFNTILLSGIVSKGLFALYYSILFYLYLQYFDTRSLKTNNLSINDVFLPLTYRQKFEITRKEAIKIAEDAKLKEIKYKTLTNISPVGIFHTSVDGNTTYVNPKWCEITGVPMDEAIGTGWLKAVHPDDVEQIKNDWEIATEQKRESEVQYRFLLKDGTIKWVLGRAVPEFNNQNQIIEYVGTITDITSIIKFQQEQIKLKEKAEESDRLKSAFLANMSHEIRTPMNGILGFADLLNEPNHSSEEQKMYIKIIKKSGERMLNIINNIVSISKIESGIINVNLEEVNVYKQLTYVYDTLFLDAVNKKLKLTINNTLVDKEATIKTDSVMLTSIISNLVKNAIKYTDRGEIEFGFSKKGDDYLFYVKDTGLGIPKEKCEAIFERFTQVEIADKMARQGAGLGLAISKAYVEMLGGKIWVESQVAKGSTFYFTVPCNLGNKTS